MAGECSVADHCMNCGERCAICIGFYPKEDWDSAELCDMGLHYIHKFGAPEHPYQEWKKRKRREAQDAERDRKRTPEFKKKSRTVKRAFKTEEKTRRAVVRATKRSGALNGDGDSRIEGTAWGIDDKFQSKARTVVSAKVSDIDKAARQGCILVVTLADGSKYALARLDHFVAAAKEMSEVQHIPSESSE